MRDSCCKSAGAKSGALVWPVHPSKSITTPKLPLSSAPPSCRKRTSEKTQAHSASSSAPAPALLPILPQPFIRSQFCLTAVKATRLPLSLGRYIAVWFSAMFVNETTAFPTASRFIKGLWVCAFCNDRYVQIRHKYRLFGHGLLP